MKETKETMRKAIEKALPKVAEEANRKQREMVERNMTTTEERFKKEEELVEEINNVVPGLYLNQRQVLSSFIFTKLEQEKALEAERVRGEISDLRHELGQSENQDNLRGAYKEGHNKALDEVLSILSQPNK